MSGFSITNYSPYNVYQCYKPSFSASHLTNPKDTVDLGSVNDEKLLFPNGVSKFTMSQGKFGDCQLIAVIDSLSYNKSGQNYIRNMVKLNSDKKSIDVYLACNDGEPINVSIKELLDEREKDSKSQKSFMRKAFLNLAYKITKNEDFKHNPREHERPLGVQAIEHAYAKYLYEKYPDKFKSSSPKDVYDSPNYHSNAQQAANDLIGLNTKYIVSADNLERVPVGKLKAKSPHPFLSSAPDDRKEELMNVLNDFSDNPDKYSITACTSDVANRKNYALWHDYSIRAYNKETETITFVNPWNTEREKNISLSEFLNNFESITYTRM